MTRSTLFRIALVFSLSFAAGPILAQPDDDRHPLLDARFIADVGAFIPNKKFRLRVDGTVPGEDVDFGDSVDVDSDETSGEFTFRWKFGEKWSVAGQYFSTSESGTATLEETIEWEDVIYEAGISVGAGFSFDVARLFFGREFSSGDRHEFGLGLGLHWMEVEAFIEGEAFVGDQTIGFERSAVDANAPLPNIGGWYWYSLSPRWMFKSRMDWFGASVGDYSGDLWNAALGIQYQPWKHVGFALDYQYFKLAIDVDKSDWRGATNITYQGPFVSVTANW